MLFAGLNYQLLDVDTVSNHYCPLHWVQFVYCVQNLTIYIGHSYIKSMMNSHKYLASLGYADMQHIFIKKNNADKYVGTDRCIIF